MPEALTKLLWDEPAMRTSSWETTMLRVIFFLFVTAVLIIASAVSSEIAEAKTTSVATVTASAEVNPSPCAMARSQKDCDRAIMSQRLVEAGLPANPADIIGSAFCASSGGGDSWCGTIIALTSTQQTTRLSVLISRLADRHGYKMEMESVTVDLTKGGWSVSGKPVDWVHIGP